jgi:hypothetical protein
VWTELNMDSSHLDPYRYIYYESLELSRLFNRVYQKHHQNPIAIIVLKLLFGDIDNFIRGASEDLIGEIRGTGIIGHCPSKR